MAEKILANSFGYLFYPGSTKDLLTLMCVILGLFFGVLALKLVLIISTSLFGSGMVAWSVGYFAGDFPNSNDLEQYASEGINGEAAYSIPSARWGYLAGIIVLFDDVAEYVEKKTARNQNQYSVDMEAPPSRRQRQVHRHRDVQEQRHSRQVPEIREVRLQQTPSKNRIKKQQAPRSPPYSSAPRQHYVDLNATDEIIEYGVRMPRQKRIIYSERESDLYKLEFNRESCVICGEYAHRDSSICSEKVVRIEKH
ncbi:hypothetical protein JG688_00011387 [Phytophthora aleatoria]|uniref:Transmembrane protein 198 n=1 Tax=Phytophthora aleatoria TaxID=2496075 RepID=A0A8J5M2R6_9STRA|nr:hypothetical protein JG688_00011387 [Phytophthora aleatoria]